MAKKKLNKQERHDNRIMNSHLKQEARKPQAFDELYSDSDDTFAFIAGYTDGGVPFGTTWEELGLESYASPEEIEKAYARIDGITEKIGINESEYELNGEIFL